MGGHQFFKSRSVLTIWLCIRSVAFAGHTVEMDASREDSYLAGSRADCK